MAAPTAIRQESITAEPVIIHTSDAQSHGSQINQARETSTSDPAIIPPISLEQRITALEKALEAVKPPRVIPYNPNEAVVIERRGRSRSYSRVRRISSPSPTRVPTIHNTKVLSSILSSADPDTLATIQAGPEHFARHNVYISTLSFHSTFLPKIKWLFDQGMEDVWITNPGLQNEMLSRTLDSKVPSFANDIPRMGIRRHPEYYDDRVVYDDGRERGACVMRVGGALNYFNEEVPAEEKKVEEAEKKDVKNDTEAEKVNKVKINPGLKKVKFIVAVQGKTNPVWTKLLVCYSKKGALVEMFHELLNGNSIIFVGAVLTDTKIPTRNEDDWRRKKETDKVKFVKVESVEEMEKCGEGVIGIIC